MDLPVVIASDFSGLIEFGFILLVWPAGMLCGIIAVALARRRHARRGGSGPCAFLAIVSTVVIFGLLASAAASEERADWRAFLLGALPGVLGVLCLIYDRPRRR
jgi:hypothetical protein